MAGVHARLGNHVATVTHSSIYTFDIALIPVSFAGRTLAQHTLAATE